jgi:hypothetical protein
MLTCKMIFREGCKPYFLILKSISKKQIGLSKIITKHRFKCKSGKDESADTENYKLYVCQIS